MKKRQLLHILSEFGDNDEIAVPIIWSKTDVEEAFSVVLTDDEWTAIVRRYTNGDHHDIQAMEDAVDALHKEDK